MKKIKKIIILMFVLLLLLIIPLNTSAQTVAGESIQIDDEFAKKVEFDDQYTANYNKNYSFWWYKAPNQGVHGFASVDDYYGIFHKYDANEDTLYILLVNRKRVAFKGEYDDHSYPYLADGQYHIKKVIQYFGIYGVNCEEYKLGRSTPSTKEEYSTIIRSISTGIEIGSDGDLKTTVEETTSVSKQIDDISYEIHDNNEHGKKWTYTANTHSNQTKSEFVAVASQVYYLKKASDYTGKDFKFICDGYVEWDLPIRGREHYHPNTNDGDNDHINLRKEYIYTVPQF